MLDADLDHVEGAVTAGGVEAAADDAEVTAPRPTTISEWIQSAPVSELRTSLKSLCAENCEVADQIKRLLQEERSHQDWVGRQETVWTKPPTPKSGDGGKNVDVGVKDTWDPEAGEDFEVQARFVPLRLTSEERSLLGILEGALYVSEYTDQVDVYHVGNKSRRMALQIQQVCAIVAGLVVANNFDVAKKPLMERDFAENRHFFRAVFEIGRRYKILNPDKFRGSYGKLIHMLQDSVKDEVIRAVDFECVAPMRSVHTMLMEKRGAADLAKDPLLFVATREVYEGSKSRTEVAAEVREKGEALKELKRKYAVAPAEDAPGPKRAGDLAELLRGKQTEGSALTEDNVETIVASISDHFAFQRFNREPCDRMIHYLKTNFGTTSGAERRWSLEIQHGRAGSCLTHSHRTQYTFVLQSLLLWREIMGNMFALWQMTEEDLLDSSLRYRLCDTGQGLNRMQSAPRVSRMMHQILHKVQSEVGSWVGLSVVHLGDRDVPNAFVFIDKYTQVPRILAPIARVLDMLPDVYARSPALAGWLDSEFGGVESLRMLILQDFFRHGFDGSGDDGGSCVDGRITSCWNWCSKIEKKKYFPAFLVTGFVGFDGGGFSQGFGQ